MCSSRGSARLVTLCTYTVVCGAALLVPWAVWDMVTAAIFPFKYFLHRTGLHKVLSVALVGKNLELCPSVLFWRLLEAFDTYASGEALPVALVVFPFGAGGWAGDAPAPILVVALLDCTRRGGLG
jgi:hypothetical protein